MKIRSRYTATIAIGFFLMILTGAAPGWSGQYGKAPEAIQAALFVKLLSFHQGLGEDISVYVMDAPAFAKNLKELVGEPIGKGKLSIVETGEALPGSTPSALYLGSANQLDAALTYTRAKGVLSITGSPELVPKGVSLGVGVSGGKPQILLNISSSKAEGVDWSHAILKVSTTF